MNIIKILKELKPIYYKDLPKIKFLTREQMQYKELIEILNKIKKDKIK